jgi:L-amino acid N-acyltransferase
MAFILPRCIALYAAAMGEISIRDATYDDLPVIVDLLNVFIDSRTYEYREFPHTVAARVPWMAEQHERGFPVLVAEDTRVGVVGFATYDDFRDSIGRPGYRFTVEHTIQVFESAWGRGVGRMLMSCLLERASLSGAHVMVGAIDGSNTPSLAFHARLGFVETARMPQVGWKHDHWCDLVLMQR